MRDSRPECRITSWVGKKSPSQILSIKLRTFPRRRQKGNYNEHSIQSLPSRERAGPYVGHDQRRFICPEHVSSTAARDGLDHPQQRRRQSLRRGLRSGGISRWRYHPAGYDSGFELQQQSEPARNRHNHHHRRPPRKDRTVLSGCGSAWTDGGIGRRARRLCVCRQHAHGRRNLGNGKAGFGPGIKQQWPVVGSHSAPGWNQRALGNGDPRYRRRRAGLHLQRFERHGGSH